MSEPGSAIVDAYYHAWAQGQVAALDGFCTSDFVGHDPASGPRFDREGLKQHMKAMHQILPGFKLVTEGRLAQDNLVAHRWRVEATSGRTRVAFTGITIYRLRDGRIAELWNEWDNMRLLRAVLTRPRLWPGYVRYSLGRRS